MFSLLNFTHFFMIAFLIIYIISHLPLDLYMLTKKKSSSSRLDSPDVSYFEGLSIIPSTVLFWFYLFIAPILYFSKSIHLYSFSVSYNIQLSLNIIGIVLMSISLVIACLGRVARGLYMARDEIRLATSLGHAVVRHPEYFMYIICFSSLFLVSFSPYLLILLLGIPGYISISIKEEESLLQHFGDEYKQYMKRVGRFFPKFKSDNE